MCLLNYYTHVPPTCPDEVPESDGGTSNARSQPTRVRTVWITWCIKPDVESTSHTEVCSIEQTMVLASLIFWHCLAVLNKYRHPLIGRALLRKKAFKKPSLVQSSGAQRNNLRLDPIRRVIAASKPCGPPCGSAARCSGE